MDSSRLSTLRWRSGISEIFLRDHLTFGGSRASPIPAGSRRKVFFSGTSILKVENGKVTEEIGQEGAIDALLQLGAVNETVAAR